MIGTPAHEKAMVGDNQALSITKNSKLQKCAFETVST